MAYIPSFHVNDLLGGARTGVAMELLRGDRVAIVCKIPEHVIKSIYRGSASSFFASVVKAEGLETLWLGFQVEDELDHPFTAVMPSLLLADLDHLKQVLSSGKATLHCLNELNHAMLSARCSLERAAAQRALDRIENATPYLWDKTSDFARSPSDLYKTLHSAVKVFAKVLYQTMDDTSDMGGSEGIPLTLEIWRPTDVFEISPTLAGGPFRIDDADEGAKLEMTLRGSLDTIYPGNTFRSPAITGGSGRRELTDVLAFDDSSICVVESKAASVLATNANRSSSRRSASIGKQVNKAIRQLQGALSTLRSNIEIYDSEGNTITITNRQASLGHAIVLLSEMYAFLDWQAIALLLVEASQSERHKALFHVMDLSELNYLTSVSNSAATFSGFLAQRWLYVKMSGTGYIRARKRMEAIDGPGLTGDESGSQYYRI